MAIKKKPTDKKGHILKTISIPPKVFDKIEKHAAAESRDVKKQIEKSLSDFYNDLKI